MTIFTGPPQSENRRRGDVTVSLTRNGKEMRPNQLNVCCLVVLCLAFDSVTSVTTEKQIKLEDIEKDTLNAAHQAKLEKQVQEQQQHQQQQQYQYQYQYQQPTFQYGGQQSVSYQTPNSYFQYVVPQQYLPQTHSQYIPLSGEQSSLTSKTTSVAHGTPSGQTYQFYMSPQIASALSGYHSGLSLDALASSQPLIMTFPTSLAGLQQNQHQYYQSALQYYPSQTQQATQFYYTPQVTDQTSPVQYGSGIAAASGTTASTTAAASYPTAHQYVAYQPLTSAKGSSSYSHFISSVPQSFPTHSYTTQHGFSSLYTPQAFTAGNVYSNTETPIFVTMKAPKHLVASTGQKQQFSQLHTTTLSPLQTKYLNSPQYLAQNYNTIQSSQLYSKGSLSSGIKSTVSPPLKGSLVHSGSSSSVVAAVPGSVSSSGGSSSSSSGSSGSYYSPGSSHHVSFPAPAFKALPSRNYAV
ncbi:hypothetical protein RUM44_014000 [Polyplax serrata]|uniref:Uncharacterized protein n=1 Tax=Polyplax serrata TaxID=468196 RepID=A0ABR1BG13_POLSC